MSLADADSLDQFQLGLGDDSESESLPDCQFMDVHVAGSEFVYSLAVHFVICPLAIIFFTTHLISMTHIHQDIKCSEGNKY